jgi:Protein of unknown function (DUF2848)
MRLSLIDDRSDAPLELVVRDVIAAGYTGRDQAAVRRHIDELAAHGVPAPARVPAFYRVTPDRVVCSDRISVLGRQTSGEAEFALMRLAGEVYIAAASDHTDRALERTSVPAAKQASPKLVSRRAWRLADVREQWDTIRLRAFSGDEPYQDGTLAQLMTPEAIIAQTLERIGCDDWPDGLVILSGTLGLLRDLECADRFAVELADDAHGRCLRLDYHVDAADPVD